MANSFSCSALGTARGQARRRRRPRWRAPGVFQTALEFAHDARQVAMHRRARRSRIARADRVQDGGVIADRLARELLRMKVTLQAPPQLGALIPQALDDKLQRTVAGRLGNGEVKLSVARP